MAIVARAATEAAPAAPGLQAVRNDEHTRLCGLAKRWLMRPNSAGGPGCGFAITEGWGDGPGEKPDAIGWRRSPYNGGAIVVEAKASRADFLADARKPHRQDPCHGVGRWRYYLCPEGLITPAELPARWGLLYATRRGSVRAVAGPAAVLPHNRRGEPVRDAAGAIVGEYTAYQQACTAFEFTARNHDLETAMLVALLVRIGDPEALNLKLRVANGQVASLIKQLNATRDELRNAQYRLMAAHAAAQGDDVPAPARPRASMLDPSLPP